MNEQNNESQPTPNQTQPAQTNQNKPALAGVCMGPEVTLVSAGEESAFELKRLLKAGSLRADEGQTGGVDFYVSDRPEDFEKIASVFLGTELSHGAERINIEQY